MSGSGATGDPVPTGAPLTLGLAITVAVWAAGYVCHMPIVSSPAPVTLSVFLVCLLAGGWLSGRLLGSGPWRHAAVGLVAGLVNLLIIGSVAADGAGQDPSDAILPSIALWAPGSILVTTVLILIGARFGARTRRPDAPSPADQNWTGRLALVVVGATSLLVLAGGLVTGTESGLAVDDWPTSFASNMFLLPLSRMTGAVYYEHAHRLLGALVGLTTVILAIYVWARDSRPWLRSLVLGAVLLVIAQGILGGLRVTSANVPEGGITHVSATDETSTSTILRIIHGVLAQMFFSVVVAIAAFTSRPWRLLPEREESPEARTDLRLVVTAPLVLIVQLVLGAVVRHLGELDPDLRQIMLTIHLAFAIVVTGLLSAVAGRFWARHQDRPILPPLGALIILLVVVQMLLGVAALYVTADGGTALTLAATVTTLHQATGAGLLASSLLLAIWAARQLRPARTPSV